MNWYLCKSEIEREETADVLVDLSKIFTIRFQRYLQGFAIILDYTNKDTVVMKFSTEEKAREELANLLNAMEKDKAHLAQEMQPLDKTKDVSDSIEKLVKLKQLLAS